MSAPIYIPSENTSSDYVTQEQLQAAINGISEGFNPVVNTLTVQQNANIQDLSVGGFLEANFLTANEPIVANTSSQLSSVSITSLLGPNTVPNSATTATTSNDPNTIVLRDSAGNIPQGSGSYTTLAADNLTVNTSCALDFLPAESLLGLDETNKITAVSAISNALTTGTSNATANTLALRDASGNCTFNQVNVSSFSTPNLVISNLTNLDIVGTDGSGNLQQGIVNISDISTSAISSTSKAGTIALRDGTGLIYSNGLAVMNSSQSASIEITTSSTNSRTYNLPDVGTTASFLLDASTSGQTLQNGLTIVNGLSSDTLNVSSSSTLADTTVDHFTANATLHANGPIIMGSYWQMENADGTSFSRVTNTGTTNTNNVLFQDSGGLSNSLLTVGNVTLTNLSTTGILHNSSTGVLTSSLITSSDIATNSGLITASSASVQTINGGLGIKGGLVTDSLGITNFTSSGVLHTNSSGNISASLITSSDISTNAGLVTTSSGSGQTITGGLTVDTLSINNSSKLVSGKSLQFYNADNSASVSVSNQGTTAVNNLVSNGDITCPTIHLSNFTTAGIVHNDTSGALSSSLIGISDISTSAISTSATANTLALRDGAGQLFTSVLTASGGIVAQNFSSAGVVHNNSSGVLMSSLINTSDITPSAISTSASANTIALRDSLSNLTANEFIGSSLSITGSTSLAGTTISGNLSYANNVQMRWNNTDGSSWAQIENTGSTNSNEIALYAKGGGLTTTLRTAGITIPNFTTAGVIHNGTAGALTSSLVTISDISTSAATANTVANTLMMRDSNSNVWASGLGSNGLKLFDAGQQPGGNGIQLSPATGLTTTRTYTFPDVGKDANVFLNTSTAGQSLTGGLTLDTLTTTGNITAQTLKSAPTTNLNRYIQADTNGLLSVTSTAGSSSNFNPSLNMVSYPTHKEATLNDGVVTVLASGTGSGILRKVWLAVLAGPQSCFFYITIDGNTIFGNTSTTTGTTGMNQIGLTLDQWLNAGNWTSLAAGYAIDLMGCTQCNTTEFGGYFQMDMPFSSSWSINCVSISGGSYWIQPFVDNSIPTTLNPYGGLKLYCNTFYYATMTYPTAFPLISLASPNGNGVYLKGVKCTMEGDTTAGSWIEGRFRVWTGGATALTSTYTDPGYSDSPVDATPIPPSGLGGNPTCILQSTGFEDFFLASYGFKNVSTVYNTASSIYTNGITTPMPFSLLTKQSGLILNSAYPNTIGTNSAYSSMYRFFGTMGDGMPNSTGTDLLTLTWTCGDQLVGQSGAVSQMYGVVYYYA